MKKLVPLAAVLVFTLSGCSLFHHHDHHGYPRNDETVTDAVSVSGDTIKLAQETILIKSDPTGKPVTIVWQLNPADGFRFTQRGIVIEGRLLDKVVGNEPPAVALDPGQQEIDSCKAVDEKAQAFSCVVKPTRSGVYKYSIQVVKGETVISRDPPIVLW